MDREQVEDVKALVLNILWIVLTCVVILGIIGGIVYGIWHLAVGSRRYEVNYVLNGGTMAEATSAKFKIKESYSLPFPTKSGYVFEGWFEDPNFEGERIFTLTISKRKDRRDFTLYAKFVKLNRITYNLDGGTTTNPEIVRGDETIVLSDPVKSGWVFDAWYTDSDFTKKITQIDNPNNNIILYAKWLPSYKIVYELDGGTNSASNPPIYASEKGVTLSEPSREGYTFNGWVDEEGNAITSIPVGTSEDIKLIATWSPRTYEINWILNGGVAPGNYNINSYVYGTGISQANMMKPTADDKLFLGWYIKEDDKEVLIEKIDEKVIGDITLSAKWYDNSVISLGAITDWDNVGSIYDNSATWSDEFFVAVPEELKHLAEKGVLGIKVTATFKIMLRTNGNATATTKAYITVGGKESLACSTSVTGGGYDWLSGPEMGATATEYGTTTKMALYSNTNPISIGCYYTFSSNKQGLLVYALYKHYCTSLEYSFYIAE